MNRYMQSYGCLLHERQQRQYAYSLYLLDPVGCFFERNFEPFPAEKVWDTSVPVTFYVPEAFKDLLEWVCFYCYSGNLRERERELYRVAQKREGAA